MKHKCPACNNTITKKPVTISVNYSPVFLHNEVVISNAKQFTCETCGAQFVDCGNSDQIDLQIATKLVDSKEMLQRSHLRWLRMGLFKMSHLDFAKLLDINIIYLIEVENYKRPMTEHLSDLVKQKTENLLASRRLLINNSGRKIKLTVS